MFIMLCPMVVHPPIPPNMPANRLPTPCPSASRFSDPLVLVSSSINWRVRRDSRRPIDAAVIAVGKISPMTFPVRGGIRSA